MLEKNIMKYEKYRKDVDYLSNYKLAQNASTGSKYDPNANVENKNAATMSGEVPKEMFIGINRLLMIDKLKNMYDDSLSKEYIRQIESHEIYKHDESSLLPYCVSITLYPFLTSGLAPIGGISSAPTNLGSFVGAFINLVFAVASQFAGAVSTPEFLIYFDHFVRKEYGDDYYLKANEIVKLGNRPESIDDIITDNFQQVVYSLNQPAAARNYQSAFWNIAYFDKPYFQGLFENFVFPDGTEPNWDSINWLQKRFMRWFNKERNRRVLTFPVETVNLLDNGKEYVDKEWKDFVAEMYGEGHSFFTYRSDSVDSLASCCYSKDTKVLIKDTNGAYLIPFTEIKNKKFSSNGYKIFNNGKWSKGKLVELPNRDMYRVTTANEKEMIVTDNHRNNCLGGMKLTKDLTTDDYIMFNSAITEAIPEQDLKLTYEQGFCVGAFLGDGSFGSTAKLSDGTEKIYDINFSISENKKWIVPILDEANKQLGGNNTVKESGANKDNKGIATRICSLEMVDFITMWTLWERGTYCFNKKINMSCLMQSVEFREGIMDGWYATDGNYSLIDSQESLRGYSTSKDLIDCMDAIATSLGYITSYSVDNRDDPVVFRGESFNKNHKVHCLLRYKKNIQVKLNSNLGIFKDNSYYMKINSIEKVPYEGNVFCFEMENVDDDKFTLPNGIHNFNCRLRNEMTDNTFSFTLGAGGISTGSKGVITININRLVQNAHRNNIDISDAIKDQISKVHKYLMAFNEIIKDNYNSNLLPIYNAGYISLEKQYLTIGVNGFVEGAEFLGIPISNNERYYEYCEDILKPIYEMNRAAKTSEIMFNTEFVPKIVGHYAA